MPPNGDRAETLLTEGPRRAWDLGEMAFPGLRAKNDNRETRPLVQRSASLPH